VAVRAKTRGRARKAKSTNRKGSRSRIQIVRPTRLLKRIQGALSIDLLHGDYPSSQDQLYFACLGHCYVASEAAYHLIGRHTGFVPYTRRNDDGTTHWWLYNERTKQVLDPSEPQLDGERYPYGEGHRQAFLTKRPSRRAAELIRRVKIASRI
jgi:hypothetical protein